MDTIFIDMARGELAPYRVFLVLSWIIVLALGFALGYWMQASLVLVLSAVALGLLLALWSYYALTRKIRLDLSEQGLELIAVEEPYTVAEYKDYEAGSAVLFIPILGNLFPRLWGAKMCEVVGQALKLSNGRAYKLIDQSGTKPFILRMRHSNIILGAVLR